MGKIEIEKFGQNRRENDFLEILANFEKKFLGAKCYFL
jgi:hypothetical protein